MSISNSRYAVLCDDDDGDHKKVRKNKVNNEEAKKLTTHKVSNETKNEQKKKKQKQKPKIPETKSENQWEQWKVVDEQVAEKQFVEDLEKALLESKASFEEKKNVKLPNECHVNTKSSKKKNDYEKSKRGLTVSLEQFLEAENFPVNRDMDLSNDQSELRQSINDIDDCIAIACNEKSSKSGTVSQHSRFAVLDDDDDTGFTVKVSKKKNTASKSATSVTSKDMQKVSMKGATKKETKKNRGKQMKEQAQLASECWNEGLSENVSYVTADKLIETNRKDLPFEKNQNKSKKPTTTVDENSFQSDSTKGNAQDLFLCNSQNAVNMYFDDLTLLREVRSEVEKIMQQEREESSDISQRNCRRDGFEVELKAKNDLLEKYANEIIKLREELRITKMKNQKLTDILKSAEIKKKAEIVIENEKLTQVNDELKEEMSRIFTTLEQEKSKVHELQDKVKRLTLNSQRRRSEDSLSKH